MNILKERNITITAFTGYTPRVCLNNLYLVRGDSYTATVSFSSINAVLMRLFPAPAVPGRCPVYISKGLDDGFCREKGASPYLDSYYEGYEYDYERKKRRVV